MQMRNTFYSPSLAFDSAHVRSYVALRYVTLRYVTLRYTTSSIMYCCVAVVAAHLNDKMFRGQMKRGLVLGPGKMPYFTSTEPNDSLGRLK